MSEFIGARISLVSKSDIRYVGTLHEINSEKSTVALEQVISFGTEGRRNNPEDEIAPSDSVYEYIVFRGSDVKDLRIEEPPKENEPPQLLNDPAILGSGSRPQQSPQPPTQQQQQQQQQPQQQQDRQPRPPHLPQQPPFPYYYPPPPNQRFGPQGGFPGAPGFPPLPYGAPPGWYPPPGQGFPHPPGPFQSPPMPPMPPGPAGPKQAHQQPRPIGPAVRKDQKPESQQDQPDKSKNDPTAEISNKVTAATAEGQTQQGPPLPVESKPDIATALAPAAPPATTVQAPNHSEPASAPSGPPRSKSGRIVPAVPLANSQTKPSAANSALQANSGNAGQRIAAQPGQAAANAALEYQNATQAATAAVAAAMAKLPPAPAQNQQGDVALDNLTKKVNEMRTKDLSRTARQPGASAHGSHQRGGIRGNYRGGAGQQHVKRVEVPTTDFDFESANAKFNKQDLVKEAIATGSPVGTPGESGPTNSDGENPINGTSKNDLDSSSATTPYNKSSSFFDNISSESKDRDEANGRRPGGREWRGEEQKKNLETFGQGSVDSGYRGSFRGRGRGRGAGRGRGGFGGPGGYRGQRGAYRGTQGSTAAGNPAVNAQS